MIKVNHSQWVKIANNKAAVEMKNSNQYNPLDFLFTSIEKMIFAKVGEKSQI